MPEIREPSIKDQSLTDKLSLEESVFVTELRKKIQEFDIDGTSSWRDKMQTARNQRQGIKRIVNIPYPGAPDIPLPETDKLIRKQKPLFVLSSTSGKNFISVSPAEGRQQVTDQMKEMARKAEMAMNDLFKNKIPWAKRLTLAVDRFLEKGFVNFKVVEKFTSRMVSHVIDLKEFDQATVDGLKEMDRDQKIAFLSERYGLDPEIDSDKETINDVIKDFNSGEEVIEFNTEEVTSMPDVLVPMPEKVFVPKGTTDLNKASRITHEFFLPEHVILDKALKNIYMKKKVMKVLKEDSTIKTGDKDINEKLKDRLAGISDNEMFGDMFRMHEVYTWYQPKEGKPFERWVFTFFADVGDAEEALVQMMPYPFEFEGWNWTRHDNEILDENHFRSRGIPEQIRGLQEFMERSYNNMLIRDQINNSPMFTVLNTSKLRSNNIRFIPGQRVPVASHDEIKPLIEGRNVDVQSERINQITKAFAEEYIGVPDQLFRNATNKGGGKTLGEVEAGLAQTQFLNNLDIMLWLDTLSIVYTIVFNVFKERLTTPLIINGETITREDFQFIPDIRANGSVESADKVFQEQRAFLRLQTIRQFVQDGIATPDDFYNAAEAWLERNGVTNPDEFITDPKEILQQKITQMQQQAQQLNGLIQQQNQVLQQGEQALDKTQGELKQRGGNGQPTAPARETSPQVR